MNYLGFANFNVQTIIVPMPIVHYVREALDNHKQKISLLKHAESAKPVHLKIL